MFNFWDACTEPLTEPLGSWAANDPPKTLGNRFDRRQVKIKWKTPGLRWGLRCHIFEKYRTSPFTGKKIILKSFLHRFESSFEVTEPTESVFWARIRYPGFRKSICPSTFWQKSVRALPFETLWPIFELWTWFFIQEKAEIYRIDRIQKWWPHGAPTEPPEILKFEIQRKLQKTWSFSNRSNNAQNMHAQGSVEDSVSQRSKTTDVHLSQDEKNMFISFLDQFQSSSEFTDPTNFYPQMLRHIVFSGSRISISTSSKTLCWIRELRRRLKLI